MYSRFALPAALVAGLLLCACGAEPEPSKGGSASQLAVLESALEPIADLSVAMTDGKTLIGWTHVNSYTIEVTNAGPDALAGAKIVDTLPGFLIQVTWTCTGAAGGTCGATSGSGNLSTTADLPAGGQVVYTIAGTVIDGVEQGSLVNTVTVNLPAGSIDPNTGNNSATDMTEIGQPRTVTVRKAGGGQGTVASSPAGIDCGSNCSVTTGLFVQDQEITLTATPAPFNTFAGWSDRCSGTSTTCAIPVHGNPNVIATFEPITHSITSTAGPGGTITPSGTRKVPHGTDVTFAIAPAGGYHLVDVVADGVSVGAVISYTFANVAGDHTLAAVFAINLYPVMVDAGPHGTVTCASPVAHFASSSCTIVPDAGYTLDTFLDNGVSAFAVVADGSYTTPALDGPRIISATFKMALAGACTTASDCHSGFCVDGVCCESACTGQCEACDVAGAAGTCTPVAGSPHGARAACVGDGSACAGACDGVLTTACVYPGTATACRGASCEDGTGVLAATCQGTGACPMQTQDCGAYACGVGACLGDCTADTDCAEGNWCSAGVCVADLPSGQACGGEHQCGSGHCVDGVCCDTACTGQCEACDVAGAEGVCTPVDGVPHGGRPACATDDTVCGGACVGAVSVTDCVYSGEDTSCRDPSCEAGVATLAAACDGAGACPPVRTQDCGDYVCGPTACRGDCTATTDCADGFWCAGGVCTPELQAGQACAGDDRCGTGHCVDGVCCDTGCDGQCAACDVPGSVGTCTPVVGAPHGGRAPCASDGSVCGGACDGDHRDVCRYPDEETTCRGASCEEGRAVASAVCDGTGSCASPAVTTCEPFACDGTTCAEACATAADCAPGHSCVEGACAEPEGEDRLARLEDYGVRGSGCAAGGRGSAGTAGILLVLAGLLALGSRRARSVCAAAALLGAPVVAGAVGDDVAIEVQRFQPSGGARDILAVGSAQTVGHLRWGLTLFGNYAKEPMKLADRTGEFSDVGLLDHQAGLDVTGWIGLFDRFELSLALPVTVSQGLGNDLSGGLIPEFDANSTEGGFSSLRVVPKARLLSVGDLHFAFAAPVILPLGSGAPYLDPGGPSIHPRAIVEWGRGVRVAANLGLAIRGERDLADLALGPALTFGLGGEVPFEIAGQQFDVLGTVVGEAGLRETDAAETPMELLVGGRWHAPAGIALSLAAGPGLTSGYGTPAWRVVGGLAFGLDVTSPTASAPVVVVPPEPERELVARPSDRGDEGRTDDTPVLRAIVDPGVGADRSET